MGALLDRLGTTDAFALDVLINALRQLDVMSFSWRNFGGW